MGAHRSSSSECGSPRARLLFAVITPLTRTLIQKSPNFRTSQNIANTDQLDLLGWNNQRRGQKRVVRLLPREIVRYTRGVEKFFPAKRRRRKFIVHRGRIKHAVPAVSSAGSTDPISSIRSLDPTERRIREFLEFLAAALRAGEGEGRGESLQMGGRETKQRRDRIFRWLCNSRRSPRPRRQLGSFFDRCGARNAAPRREISERVGGGGKRARPFPLYPTILDFYSSRYIHIYILFLRAISVYRRRIFLNPLLIYGDVDRLGEAQCVRTFGRIKIERENFTIRKRRRSKSI